MQARAVFDLEIPFHLFFFFLSFSLFFFYPAGRAIINFNFSFSYPWPGQKRDKGNDLKETISAAAGISSLHERG